MRIAAFNVENLFDRARVFNEKQSVSNKIISSAAELNNIFEQQTYTDADKKTIIKLLKKLGIGKTDNGKYAILRKIRGRIVSRPRNKPIKVVANGRKDWIGHIELKTAPINEIAVRNTGKVIRDVDADILAVIEAEDRKSLEMFSKHILEKVNGVPYEEVMLIDGNDDRGIDVAVMCKNDYIVQNIQSHIYDLKHNGQPVFSRDCPEYEIITPNGNQIIVLPNHFKSKFGGDDRKSKAKRKAQAKRTAEIYNRLRGEGFDNIVVLGDLNDTPDSAPLKPLLKDTDLKDVSEHPIFDPGEYRGIGTYGLGNDSGKIDYLLLSPALFRKITSCGLFRKGAWPGKRPIRWETYDDITKKIHVASDHHLIYADIDIR